MLDPNKAVEQMQSEFAAGFQAGADAFGTHYTDDQRDWMDTPGIESVTCLYSPKGLK